MSRRNRRGAVDEIAEETELEAQAEIEARKAQESEPTGAAPAPEEDAPALGGEGSDIPTDLTPQTPARPKGTQAEGVFAGLPSDWQPIAHTGPNVSLGGYLSRNRPLLSAAELVEFLGRVRRRSGGELVPLVAEAIRLVEVRRDGWAALDDSNHWHLVERPSKHQLPR